MDQKHGVTLSAQRQIPVMIWVVPKPSDNAATVAEMRTRIEADIANLQFLYDENHCGLEFDVSVEDHSPRGSTRLNCDDVRAGALALQQKTGHLNFYYSDLSSANHGEWCEGEDVGLVNVDQRDMETLAHEFGHAFGTPAEHNDTVLDQSNVMRSVRVDGAVRSVFTLGQCFRFSFDKTSKLQKDAIVPAPPGVGTLVACPWNSETKDCPHIRLR